MKRLEEFVKENKKQFEVKGPSSQLWDKISAELEKKEKPKKSIKLYQFIGIAAMLAVVVGGFLFYNTRDINSNIKVADVSPMVGKKEVQFVNLIEEKKDSLAIYATANPDLYQKFTSDLAALNTDYEKLKKDLQTTPNRQFVVKAMMKNLELQSQVLTQQLTIINQVNQYKKENSI